MPIRCVEVVDSRKSHALGNCQRQNYLGIGPNEEKSCWISPVCSDFTGVPEAAYAKQSTVGGPLAGTDL